MDPITLTVKSYSQNKLRVFPSREPTQDKNKVLETYGLATKQGMQKVMEHQSSLRRNLSIHEGSLSSLKSKKILNSEHKTPIDEKYTIYFTPDKLVPQSDTKKAFSYNVSPQPFTNTLQRVSPIRKQARTPKSPVDQEKIQEINVQGINSIINIKN
jgi:hypothetical protein